MSKDLSTTRFINHINHRYILAVALIAFLFIFAYAFLQYKLNQNSLQAKKINVSGQQRMLSQRIIFYSNMLVREQDALQADNYAKNLANEIERMRHNHSFLLDEMPAAHTQITRDIHDIFFQAPHKIDENVKLYLDDAQNILSQYQLLKSDPQITPNYDMATLAQMTAYATTDLLQSLDDAVKLYEKNAQQKIEDLKSYETIVLICGLLILFLEVILIFRPLSKRILTQMTELEDKTNEATALIEAIEASSYGIVIYNPTPDDYPIVYVNSAFIDMCGYDRQDILGQPYTFLCGPNTPEKDIQKMELIFKNQSSNELEILSQRKDGTIFNNAIRISPVSNGKDIVAFIAIQNDVTDFRKKMAKDMQKQKLEAIGKLAGGAAHEINNYLQPVILIAEMIGEEQAIAKDEHLNKSLALIIENAKNAKNIVRGLTQFARKDSLKRSYVHLYELLNEALDLICDNIPSNITVQRNGLTNPDTIFEDEAILCNVTEFNQVITNIVDNALFAMDDNGTLTFDAQISNIPLLKAESLNLKDGKYLELSIKDTGHGMSEAILNNVFEPFFTTKSIGQGPGLGLSTVYGIVKSLGGGTTIKSSHKNGTTVKIFLPINLDYIANAI